MYFMFLSNIIILCPYKSFDSRVRQVSMSLCLNHFMVLYRIYATYVDNSVHNSYSMQVTAIYYELKTIIFNPRHACAMRVTDVPCVFL